MLTYSRLMLTTSIVRRLAVVAALAVVFIAAPSQARAQGYIAPLIGYDFGGDAGCPTITNCEDKRANYGVALGAMGNVIGFEEEFAYAKDFFGVSPGLPSSSVLTLMSNLMLIPKIGPARPYVLAGLGLMKSHIDLTPSSLLSLDNNNFAWDVGGGLMVLFGNHIGVRGDIRYFHSFQDVNLLGVSLGSTKLDFGRAAAALVLKF